jgi:NADH-quinone oxidoreductase subunit N
VVLLVHRHEGTFDLRDYPGLMRRAPVLAVTLSLFLLSLMGIPPFVGFVAKLYVFAAVIDKGLALHAPSYFWLAAIGALNAAVAAFYYARVLKAIIIDREEPGEEKPAFAVPAIDRAWVVAFAVANLVPVLAWSIVEGWTREAVKLASR